MQYTYELSAKVKKLDVVWMIDNSGSMQDNIKAVQDNMQSFVGWLKQQGTAQGIDVKAILISCDTAVHPNPRAGTQHSADRYCMDMRSDNYGGLVKIIREWDKDDSAYMPQLLMTMATKQGDALARELRADSTKIFLVVTDEGAHQIANKFIEVMDKKFGKDKIKFFSYSSPRPTSIDMVLANDPPDSERKPRQAMKDRASVWLPRAEQYFNGLWDELSTGAFFYHNMCGSEMSYSHVYEYLAKHYQGKLYNICSRDWTQHFKNLQGDIKHQIERTVELIHLARKSNLKLISVAVDQSVLSASDYTYTPSNPPVLTLHTSRDAVTVDITVSHD